MKGIWFVALAAVAWYLSRKAPSVAAAAPAPVPSDGEVSIMPVEDFRPAETAEAANAYDGLPPGTPVVYIDGNGQVRETNAVYLSQSLAAAVLMRNGEFLPRTEDVPRLAPGTGDYPGHGYVL